MKKFLILFILLGIITTANATGTPKWNEFAPEGYENPIILTDEEIELKSQELADTQSKRFYCKSDSTTAKVLRGITILPAIDCFCANKISKSNHKSNLHQENKKNTYWLKRKQQFENELKTCKNLSNYEKAMCYMKIRELELQKNHNLEQKQELQSIQRQLQINNMQQNQIYNQIQQQNYK